MRNISAEKHATYAKQFRKLALENRSASGESNVSLRKICKSVGIADDSLLLVCEHVAFELFNEHEDTKAKLSFGVDKNGCYMEGKLTIQFQRFYS